MRTARKEVWHWQMIGQRYDAVLIDAHCLVFGNWLLHCGDMRSISSLAKVGLSLSLLHVNCRPLRSRSIRPSLSTNCLKHIMPAAIDFIFLLIGMLH